MEIVDEIRQQQKQREKSFRLGRYTNSGNRTYLTVKTEGGRTRLDNKSKHKMLNSIAKGWGKINERKTILNEGELLIKWYSCSGHGGYLVASDKPLDFAKQTAKLNRADYPNFPPDFSELEFYFYEFEEDCGWSILYKFGGTKVREAMDKEWRKSYEDYKKEPPCENLEELANSTFYKWYKSVDNIV